MLPISDTRSFALDTCTLPNLSSKKTTINNWIFLSGENEPNQDFLALRSSLIAKRRGCTSYLPGLTKVNLSLWSHLFCSKIVVKVAEGSQFLRCQLNPMAEARKERLIMHWKSPLTHIFTASLFEGQTCYERQPTSSNWQVAPIPQSTKTIFQPLKIAWAQRFQEQRVCCIHHE